MSAPEFSRPARIDSIGAGARDVAISADESECAALAARFSLLGIERLEARFTVRHEMAGITARGHVSGAVTQTCSVTGDAIAATIDEEVALRFVAEAPSGEDELELSEDDCDTMLFDGAAIDLGEAAAETMVLALDPFPRGPRAQEALREAGVIGEDEVKPRGALAGLKAALEAKR